MAESEFLSDAELRDLTDKIRRAEQAKVLDTQGIPFKEVGRRLVVLRRHVVAWMETRPVAALVEPDWSAIR